MHEEQSFDDEARSKEGDSAMSRIRLEADGLGEILVRYPRLLQYSNV